MTARVALGRPDESTHQIPKSSKTCNCYLGDQTMLAYLQILSLRTNGAHRLQKGSWSNLYVSR